MTESSREAPPTQVDYVELLSAPRLSPAEFLRLRRELFANARDRRAVVRSAQGRVQDGSARNAAEEVGLCLAAAGEHEAAIPLLEGSKSPAAGMAHARCLLALRRSAAALALLEGLARQHGGDLDVIRALLEAHEQSADPAAFEKALTAHKRTLQGTADLHYAQGFLHESRREYDAAMEEYQKAVDIDPEHLRSLFRLAYRKDMAGHDEDAVELYERCRKIRPTFAAVYLNLGVLYDDREEYQEAIDCFQALLDIEPNHERARLFLKDAVASLDMYYDEDQERREDKLNQILRIPVTDFELSVRSRNCLERMRIRTLGDLIKKTEPELLSYKNFGETSLAEIKEILASKNLKLGMGREELERTAGKPDAKIEKLKAMITGIGTPTDDVLAKPISELELSVRSRRCMTRLGIQTVNDLVQKTEEELLATRNFGQTSLVEIREKLRTLGLNLKND